MISYLTEMNDEDNIKDEKEASLIIHNNENENISFFNIFLFFFSL